LVAILGAEEVANLKASVEPTVSRRLVVKKVRASQGGWGQAWAGL